MDMKADRRNGSFSRYNGVVLAGAVLASHLALLRVSSSVPSHHFLFVFYFVSMILVPGYFLSRYFFPAMEAPGRVLLSFIFGTAVMFCLLLIAALLRLDLFYLGAAAPALSVIFSAGLIPRGRNVPAPEAERRPPSKISVRAKAILVLLSIFAGVLIIGHGDPMLYTSDSTDHIAYIRTVARTHEAFPDRNLYRDGGMLTRDIRKGLMHAAWGTISLLTGRIDVYPVWPLISLIGAVFTILAFFCLGWLIFDSPAIGLLSAIIFVFMDGGGLSSYRLIQTAYSFQTGMIFSMAFLISIFHYLRFGGKGWLALMGGAAFAGTGTHVGHLFVCAFIILYVIGGKLIGSGSAERRDLIAKRLPATTALAVGVNAPYLLMRYFRDYAPNNEIHTHLQGIFSISGGFYVFNPVVYLVESGFVVLLGILAVCMLWRRSREDESLRILLWGYIAVWLVLFNPILYPLLLERVTYLVMRIRSAVPVPLLVAVLVKMLWDRARGNRNIMSAKVAAVGWAALIVSAGYQIALTRSEFAYSRDSVKQSRFSCLNISDLYERINSLVPAGSVIVSDPITSYCIPAFTDQYIVCTNSQHSIPNDSTALERIGECRSIFSPLASMSDRAEVLRKHEAGYIAVNGRIPVTTGTMYWKPDGRTAQETVERLESYPRFFELLYEKDGVALFRIAERFLAADTGTSASDSAGGHTGEPVSPAALSGYPPSGTTGIFVKSLHVAGPSVTRGDTLEIEIDWVLDRELEYRSYLAHIRFDSEFDKGALYHKAYGKIYRKLLERKNGRRYRFRAGHLPFNGIFTPDMWPLFRVVHDRAIVTVPRDIAPGEYVISIRMSENTQYPNYSLADLLSDGDSFDGPDMATIVIR